jgi:hypothetical protein
VLTRWRNSSRHLCPQFHFSFNTFVSNSLAVNGDFTENIVLQEINKVGPGLHRFPPAVIRSAQSSVIRSFSSGIGTNESNTIPRDPSSDSQ